MRQHYLNEIAEIDQDLQNMCQLVEDNIAKALLSLTTQDGKIAKEVIAADELVNTLELTITDKCILFIAKEQPVAGDLRKVVACLKIAGDIERIGDYVVHAAKRAKDLSEEQYIKPLIDIPKMLALGGTMLHDAVTSLIKGDVDLAQATAKRDAEMDNLNKQVYRELLALMLEEKDNIKQATKLLFLSRFLERMGDHAVNICSWAIYTVTSEHTDL